MMKFCVDTLVTSGGRLGTVTQAVNGRLVTMETPMCTLFTKGGCAPHLSASMLERISQTPEVVCMSLSHMAMHHENIKEFGKGLGHFSGMKDKVVFSTLHDTSLALFSGKNDYNSVAVWNKNGKMKLTTKIFMNVQEAFQPHWFQALSDGDTDKSNARKRLTKAVDRTLDFLDDILEIKDKSDKLKDASVFGVIEGGYNVQERIRSAKETSARSVDGFYIEGFQKGNTEEDIFSDEEFVSVIKETLTHLPAGKPVVMESVWSPLQVVKGFQLGVDVFSSAYPHTLTDLGRALTVDLSLPPGCASARLELSDSDLTDNVSQHSAIYVDLNDKRFFEVFSPIKSDCSCYTCQNFTCSYIHHLLNTSELLAYVLLSIHNYHQYFELFRRLREVAREDRMEEFLDSLVQQEAQMQNKNEEQESRNLEVNINKEVSR